MRTFDPNDTNAEIEVDSSTMAPLIVFDRSIRRLARCGKSIVQSYEILRSAMIPSTSENTRALYVHVKG